MSEIQKQKGIELNGFSEAADNQWRLCEVQLYNWGTFGGYHVVPLSPKGHLFTGDSGSGKSSLLDGLSAVITPDRWLRFNEAAQGQRTERRGEERTAVSYVRGAWSRGIDDEDDAVVSRYLRPGPTFSAVMLHYSRGEEQLSIARLFFISGSSTSKDDLRDTRFLLKENVNLDQFLPFMKGGLLTAEMRKVFPKATITTKSSHLRFFARIKNILGLGEDTALRLLHVTQSAKNMASLDQLFRTTMLDMPKTFKIEANAREQFQELRDSHQIVVDLRNQSGDLKKICVQLEAWRGAEATALRYGELLKHTGVFQHKEEVAATERELERSSRAAADAARDLAQVTTELGFVSEERETARAIAAGAGGAQVERLRVQLDEATRRLGDVIETRRRLDDTANEMAVPMPRSATELEELKRELQSVSPRTEDASYRQAAHAEVSRLEEEVRKLTEAIDVLRRSKSNLDTRRQKVRAALAEILGVSPAALPFAGELIDVKPRFADWQGAIERVVRPLAQSLLVPAEHLDQVRALVDRRHLGFRLDYYSVGSEEYSLSAAASDKSLLNRVDVKPGRFAGWILDQLSRRFDYACVDSPEELEEHKKALTIKGQVKMGLNHYVKDDRYEVEDRSNWILGANNSQKKDDLAAALRSATLDLKEATLQRDTLEKQHILAIERDRFLRDVAGRKWEEMDPTGAQSVRDRLQVQMDAISTGNSALAKALEDIENASARIDQLSALRDQLRSNTAIEENKRDGARKSLEQLKRETQEVSLDDETEIELRELFYKGRRRLDVMQLKDARAAADGELRKKQDESRAEGQIAQNRFGNLATKFLNDWPLADPNLEADVRDGTGFEELLSQIETEGLPNHEKKFLQLFREKSVDQVVTLLAELRDAFQDTKQRIEPVNVSLSRSEYEPGKYLQIVTKQRLTVTAKQFRDDLSKIVAGDWDDSEAEMRFSLLNDLMERLASKVPGDRRWREECLDTRQHVTFQARVLDQNGQETARYDSAGGLSGGQKQKLVVFCLAAALRFQLTSSDEQWPSYGTVAMDEAFDKTSPAYARMTLDVFKAFGFHMVLATPLKMIQTLEPYVGAITHVTNLDGTASRLQTTTWEDVSD